MTRGTKLAPEPLLSVVIPVYKVEAYLRDAVQSVLDQTYTNLEVILVDDGSPDTCPQICDSFAESDSRVRVLHQRNGGLSNARNNGAAMATGELLAFMDSDDLLYPDSYRRMVASLVRTGSDFVTGNVQRFNIRSRWQAWNQSTSHTLDRAGTTLRQHPELLYDTVAWNKVFRRSFFVDNRITFPEGKLYEDMVPMFRAYRAAQGIDVLREPVYLWRVRSEKDSITQQRAQYQNLADRLTMVDTIHKGLSSLRDRTLKEVFFRKTLEGDLWMYVPYATVSDSRKFTKLLMRAARKYWRRAPRESKLSLPQERRVQYAALAARKPELVQPIRDWYAEHRETLPVVYDGDEVLLDTREVPRTWPRLSHVDRVLSVETRLRSKLTEMFWHDDGSLRIRGWAYLPFWDATQQEVRLSLHERSSKTRVDVPVTGRLESEGAAIDSRDTRHDFGHVGFEGVLDVETLTSMSGTGNRTRNWVFVLEVRTPFVTRERHITSVVRGGATSVLLPRFVDDSVQVVPLHEPGEEVGLDVRRPHVVAEALDLAGRTVSVTVRVPEGADLGSGEDGPEVAVLRDDLLNREEHVEVSRTGADRASVSFELPPTDVERYVNWRLRFTVDGKSRPVAWGPGVTGIGAPESPRITLRSSVRGWLIMNESNRTVELTRAALTDRNDLVLAGTLSEPAPQLELALATDDNQSPRWQPVDVVDGRFTARFELWKPDWYGNPRPWQPGWYRLQARRPDGTSGQADATVPMRVSITQEATARLLVPHQDRQAQFELVRLQGHDLAVHIEPAIPPQDRGAYVRQRTLTRYGAGASVEPEDAVFMRVNAGYGANDSALYLQREIERRGLPLTVYWGVKSESVPVPPGGIAVVDGTSKWYEKLARARLVVNNYGGLWKYPAHPHQTYLQTWHGTPYKSIGMSEALHQGGAQSDIDRLRAEAAEWDYLLSPNPYCSGLFPKELAYDGPVLELGMPRNDLAAAATPEQRQRIREKLGLSPDDRAVLYAPTFRETQRTGLHAAIYRGLDLDQLTRTLGEGWKVLLRGHSFNQRMGERFANTDSLVDVTDVPDVGELYVAADACITDYSSVMFDFPVTGKPLYFYTPDLEAYIASRSVYFDLADVAPSPLHDDLPGLVEDLRDLDGYQARYGERYREFRNRFAPWEDGHASARVLDAVLQTG